MDASVRAATANDITSMQALEVDAGQRFREIGLPEIAQDPPPTTEHLLNHVREGSAWLALDAGGEALGYALASVVDGPSERAPGDGNRGRIGPHSSEMETAVSNGALSVWTGEVTEDWIDYNGHMSEGFYGLVFGMASDEYLLRMGFDEAYRERTKGAFYTVETHISFLDELALATPLEVRTCVVGVDDIRLHLFHELIRTSDGVVAATQESLMLHVDTTIDRVGPMTSELLSVASGDAAAQAGLVAADQIGKTIRGPQG